MFDKVWEHFVINKNSPSFTIPQTGVYRCQYRGPNNTRCSIGCLIPDEKYNPIFENQSSPDILSYIGIDISEVHPRLLVELQMSHDLLVSHDGFHEKIKKRLTSVANVFGLTVKSTENTSPQT